MIPMPNPLTFPKDISKPMATKKRRWLLNVGRLYPQKDQAVLLQAFAKIAPEYPDWDLKIVGEGPLRSMLESLVRHLNLEARVFMPGIISDLSEIYQGADLFVTSSRYESFGLATAEAMRVANGRVRGLSRDQRAHRQWQNRSSRNSWGGPDHGTGDGTEILDVGLKPASRIWESRESGIGPKILYPTRR
jgi:hypothetical protein